MCVCVCVCLFVCDSAQALPLKAAQNIAENVEKRDENLRSIQEVRFFA